MKKVIAAILAVSLSLVVFATGRPDGLLHVFFLNVGQGDAIFAITPDGTKLMFDAGPDNSVLSQLKNTMPFFENSIDYAIVSHADSDHLAGFLGVMQKYKIKNFIIMGDKKSSSLYQNFLQKLKELKTPILLADARSDIYFEDGVFLDVLYPLSQSISQENSTNRSIVAKIVYGQNSIILTGDADMEQEKQLLNSGVNLDSTVLKVAHHGSETSSSIDFLNAVSPNFSIISVGKENKYGHPNKSALDRLEAVPTKIYRTDQNGKIEFVFDKEKIVQIKTERE